MTGAGQQPELAWVCGRRGSNPVSHFIDGTPDWSRIAPLFFTFPDKGYWMLGDHVADSWSIGKKNKP
jgi:hypothetical protein